jgi:predicted nucleic acid-binding protein
MTKTLIDTNVLVYAIDKSEPEKHQVCSEMVKKLISDESAVFSIQNIVEFSRIATEKMRPKMDEFKVRGRLMDLIEVCPVISYNSETILNALLNTREYKIHFFDSLLATTMKENGINVIITENEKDFKKIPWLEVINPVKNKLC